MNNWVEDYIKSFADSFAGGTPSRSRDDYFKGSIPWISSGEVNQPQINDTVEKITQLGLENSSAKWIPKNSVLIAMYGATAGQVSKNLIDATSNQAVLALVPKKNRIDGDFLYYQVKQNKDSILYLAQGSGQPNLSKDLIDNFKIKVPNKLIVQSQIAHILSTTDAVIEKTQAAIAKYKAIKQGMLHDLFTRGIDVSTGKLRPKCKDAPELYKESKLGMVPLDWEVEKLGDYSFVTKLAGFEYTLYFDYSKSGPIIAVRALNIKQGKLSFDNIHTIPKAISDILPRSQLQKGDLVISYVGTVGQVAVIPENNKYHLAPNVAKISVDKKTVDPFFLNQFLNADVGQNEIIKLVSSTTQAALSMQNLREVKFLRPDLKEQKEIARRLINADNNKEIEQTYLHKLQMLKSGLMGDLLSGRKRVNTYNDNDGGDI
ncbi:MAG: restriction endonuclease subunit S [Bacteroidota bacterium]